MNRISQIKCYYNPKQVCNSNLDSNYSKSPSKPEKIMAFLGSNNLDEYFEVVSHFEILEEKDLLLAHTKDYVSNFIYGKGNCESNNLKWSNDFKDAILYNLSSFYVAIRNSIVNPHEVSFSPSSGFHYATPIEGRGFCTFSGQVISSVKILNEFGLAGCYLDLDGHFGNSIEEFNNIPGKKIIFDLFGTGKTITKFISLVDNTSGFMCFNHSKSTIPTILFKIVKGT
jgi:acetoin utilization deacetylase AcuC-like enzyme